MRSVYIVGMHGMGDCIHQRAIMRALSKRYDEIWLETSWPSLYYDIPSVRCIARGTSLRTQLKNATRQASLFAQKTTLAARLSKRNNRLRIWYPPEEVRRHGTVLGAMCASVGVDPSSADFRLPVPQNWIREARRVVGVGVKKPLLLYRPLVERTEWGGCASRNPDWHAYVRMFERIAGRFHVISLADLAPGAEWIVSSATHADLKLHNGEATFEVLVGLFAIAALVWTSPGFAVPLSQAVNTPVICIFGGYESSRSFAGGALYSPYLGIDTIAPCECFSHSHNCVKTIDETAANKRIDDFIRGNVR